MSNIRFTVVGRGYFRLNERDTFVRYRGETLSPALQRALVLRVHQAQPGQADGRVVVTEHFIPVDVVPVTAADYGTTADAVPGRAVMWPIPPESPAHFELLNYIRQPNMCAD